MRVSDILYAAIALAGAAAAGGCRNPEPPNLECYNNTPIPFNVSDISYVAKFMRRNHTRLVKKKRAPFFKMTEIAAKACEEFPVTTIRGIQVIGRHNGEGSVAVSWKDIADTIDPGADASDEARNNAIISCGAVGGQRAVAVNTSDPIYETQEFVRGGWSNQGIIIKLAWPKTNTFTPIEFQNDAEDESTEEPDSEAELPEDSAIIEEETARYEYKTGEPAEP